ncbi:hypothetical protein J0X14_14200 [Muricauda sp. CAU 1633]|uniref:hypothetical protein n=1 Tax=Allomuricauda sp. CAU 1633 TaxID=2816036 RepID=UPI001A8E18B4|nr:hypothetical protein [Muricauda sp. CAU 1633]MBO0323456.1 hypothetical protein [Muricauda sp. CAU 1633]
MIELVLIFLFILSGGVLGYFLFTYVFDLFTKQEDDFYRPSKYIDNSVHHHYHDNRTLFIDGDKILRDRNESASDIDP